MCFFKMIPLERVVLTGYRLMVGRKRAHFLNLSRDKD